MGVRDRLNYSELRSVTVGPQLRYSYGAILGCFLNSYKTMVSNGQFIDAVLYNSLAQLLNHRALDHGVSDLASMWC